MENLSLRRTLNRGIFHIVAGSLPAVALLLLPWPVVVLGLAAATVIFLSFEIARLHIPTLNSLFSTWLAPLLREEEQTRFTGSSYLLVGYLVTILVFPPDLALPAVLFASLGDPAATMVGVWKGRTRLWGKSVEGTSTCLLVCLATGILVATSIKEPSLLVALGGAIIATLLEALPLRVNDNVTISIGSAAAMLLLRIL